MKKTFFYLLAFFLFPFMMAQGQQKKTLIDRYLENNPKTVRTRCLEEGCNLSISVNDSNMLLQLFVAHPMMQMRLLMQEWTIYIDPTGRKKEKYAIVIPGGENVKRQMGAMPSAPSQQQRGNSKQRPEIGRLVGMLNMHGARLDVNGIIQHYYADRFSIDVDRKREAVVYTVLVPVNEMMQEKKRTDNWNIGIYMANNTQTGPSPSGPGGPGGPGGQQGGRGNRPHEDTGQNRHYGNMQDIMTKEISEWHNVSYSKIYGVNKTNTTPLSDNTVCRALQNGLEVALFDYYDTLELMVSVNDSEKHMPVIMQGLEITSGNDDNPLFHLRFPSALNVRDRLKHHPDELDKPVPKGNLRPRPDIGFIVDALNDILPETDTMTRLLDYYIELDTATSSLRYGIVFLHDNVSIFSDDRIFQLQSLPILDNDEYVNADPDRRDGEDGEQPQERGLQIKCDFKLDCYDAK